MKEKEIIELQTSFRKFFRYFSIGLAVVRDAPHKQWSKGKASEPQLEKRPWPGRLGPIGWKLGR